MCWARIETSAEYAIPQVGHLLMKIHDQIEKFKGCIQESSLSILCSSLSNNVDDQNSDITFNVWINEYYKQEIADGYTLKMGCCCWTNPFFKAVGNNSTLNANFCYLKWLKSSNFFHQKISFCLWHNCKPLPCLCCGDIWMCSFSSALSPFITLPLACSHLPTFKLQSNIRCTVACSNFGVN